MSLVEDRLGLDELGGPVISLYFLAGSIEVVTPFLESMDDREKLFVMDFILELSR